MKKFIEKLIERLRKSDKRELFNYRDKGATYLIPVSEVKSIVNQLVEEYNNGWIACSERLPEDCSDMICTVKVKDKANRDILFLWYNAETKCWCYLDGERIKGIDVLAWMPLPEPFKPKGE